jgi:hypothetical protein
MSLAPSSNNYFQRNIKKCIGLLVNHSTMCVMHCYRIVSNIQWSVCTSIHYNLLCRNSPNLNLTSVCLLKVVDVYTTATSDVLLLQMEHCRRNVWALHRPPSVGHLDADHLRCANQRSVASLARHGGMWRCRGTTSLAPVINSTSPVCSCFSSLSPSPPPKILIF